MKRERIHHVALTGVLAALITVFTAFFVHIPVGVNGGYVHFGDALIYIAASVLPLPYAMAAGAIGGGLADLMTAPAWAGATVLIKMLLVLPFTARKTTLLCRRNLAAPLAAFLISAVGYSIADVVLFGTKLAVLASLSENLVQSGGSAVFYYLLAAALDRMDVKRRMLTVTRAYQEEAKHG